MTTLAEPYAPVAYSLDRDTAPAFWLTSTLWMVHATCAQTASRFSLMEQWMPRGLGPPTHRHRLANEGFVVLDGWVAFNAEGATRRAGPGSLVHIPRLGPHSFSVDSSEAHVLNFYLPGRFELLIMAAGHSADERRRPTREESMPPSSEQVRILSAVFDQEAVNALPFDGPPAESLMSTEARTWTIGSFRVASPAQLDPVRTFGMDWRVLAGSMDTDGGYDLAEVTAGRGCSMPARLLGSDEALYVVEGELRVQLDGRRQPAKEGAFVYFPRGSIATWNATTDSRILVYHVPGGFDVALSRTADESRLRQFLEATGTRFL